MQTYFAGGIYLFIQQILRMKHEPETGLSHSTSGPFNILFPLPQMLFWTQVSPKVN